MPTITDPAILATTIEEADNVILRWGHGSMRQLPAAETAMVVAALRATTPPEALRNPQDEAVRAAWDELLEKVAIQAVLPPKKGYERRAIYITVEDENDHGSEYAEVYDVSMEELNLLRGLLCAPSPLRRSECPYCTSDNEAIRSTYYDQTCEGCVKRM